MIAHILLILKVYFYLLVDLDFASTVSLINEVKRIFEYIHISKA